MVNKLTWQTKYCSHSLCYIPSGVGNYGSSHLPHNVYFITFNNTCTYITSFCGICLNWPSTIKVIVQKSQLNESRKMCPFHTVVSLYLCKIKINSRFVINQYLFTVNTIFSGYTCLSKHTAFFLMMWISFTSLCMT